MANILRYCLFALAFALALPAQAAPIIYTFTGTGSGTLGTRASFTDAAFTVTLVGDTATVTSGGGQLRNDAAASFTSGIISTTFSGANFIILNADPTPFPAIVFAQSQPAPVFAVAEGLTNAAFPFYDLASNFALTAGTPSFIPQTFLTANGDLTFTSITAMSFQAAVQAAGGVPEPATWAMLLVGFGLVGATMRRRPQAARQLT